MLKHRVITAVILLVLFLSALFTLSKLLWALLVIVLIMQSTVEWARMSALPGSTTNAYWWLTLVMMLGLIWFDATHDLMQRVVPHLAVYGLSLILWLVVAPLWMMLRWQVRQPLLMALVGWAVLIPTGLAMMDLRENSPWLLLGIMGLVWVADSAAYFAGRRFGKNLLAPSISPGKTWEGVIGGLLGVSVYTIVAVYIVVTWKFIDYPRLMVFLPNILMASWCWVGLAVVGDLFESAIKRQAGVKDSGALLPGHGGLLDRIDALTSTLPLAAMAMMLQKLA
jgi:phosphatidate cytidylyltransferase